MSIHVTEESHPELTEDQRAEVNEIVSKWCFYSFGHSDAPEIFSGFGRTMFLVAFGRIVAEVTA